MKQEPTLLMGDLPIDGDYTLLDMLICATIPSPVRVRDSLTKDQSKVNRFYQYKSFDSARSAWKQLNGIALPSISPHFVVDLTFTLQEREYCAFFTAPYIRLSRYEVYTIMSRYHSVLGVSHHRVGTVRNEKMFHTSCVIRFGDKDDCIQAVSELHNSPFEGSLLRVTVAVRDIDELKQHVEQREAQKEAVGIPAYHNVYEKRPLTLEEFNATIISTPSYFEDLEASRWSDVAFQNDVDEVQYARQSTLAYYKYF